MTETLVSIRSLSKSFGEGDTRVDAVHGVDLDLEEGEVVLVMGPSGSGKTTLLTMLGGLQQPSAGEIRVDGVDIAALNERQLPPFRARRFGFIFQDFNLIFADEPTANLDSAHGAETMRLLRRLAKDEKTTVVIVSHDQRLREIADRVLWLEDGQLKRLEALVRDPVCKMLLDPAQAPASIERGGVSLYFCSRGCRAEYEEGLATPAS